MKLDWRFIILLVTAWILQATVIPLLAIGSAEPDIILIVVATYAFLEGPTAGVLAGFLGGLFQDLLLIRGVGLNIISKTMVGYLAGLVERTLFGTSSLLPTAVMFVVSLINQVLYIVTSFIVGDNIEIWLAFRTIILPSAIYTSGVTYLIFSWLTRFFSHERQETVFK